MSLALQECQPPGLLRVSDPSIAGGDKQKRWARPPSPEGSWDLSCAPANATLMSLCTVSCPWTTPGAAPALQTYKIPTFFNPEPCGVPGRLLGGAGRFVPLNDGGHLWGGVFFQLGLLGQGGMYSGDVDIHHTIAKGRVLCTTIWTSFNQRAQPAGQGFTENWQIKEPSMWIFSGIVREG